MAGMQKGHIKAGANVMYKGKRYRVLCREHWGGAEIFLRLAGPHGTLAARMEDCVRLNAKGEEDNGRLDIRRDQAPGGASPGTGSGSREADSTGRVGEGGEEQGEAGSEGEAGGATEGIQPREVAHRHQWLPRIRVDDVGSDLVCVTCGKVREDGVRS